MRERGHDMPGAMSDDAPESIPVWVQDEIARPVTSRGGSRAAIMTRVRAERRPMASTHRMSPPMRMSRWTRRGLLSPFGAAAFAGVLGLLLSVRSISTLQMTESAPSLSASAVVLRDTVMPSFRDTLRIVEFVLRGPNVRSADVVGDFNAWRRGANALERRSDGAWYARIVVPRNVVHFSYVVNDGQAATVLPPGVRVPPDRLRARIDSI
jgi:hypothetical protein